MKRNNYFRQSGERILIWQFRGDLPPRQGPVNASQTLSGYVCTVNRTP